MKNNKQQESFMPQGKDGSPEWIAELLEYHRLDPKGNANEILNIALNRDRLTTALNVGGIENILDALETQGTPMGLIYIDFNDFSEVNNTRGHDVGDSVLVDTSRILMDELRTKYDRRIGQVNPKLEQRKATRDRRTYNPELIDLVFKKLYEGAELGRKGGDEFLAILPGERTFSALKAVGMRLASKIIETPNCQTSSMGGTLYLPGMERANAIREADSAMYLIKEILKERKQNQGLTETETGLALSGLDGKIKTYTPADMI